ncbi:PEP-CTERM protein-sorting domain-containing protein [Desulfonema limicola]|uniref:PEP-CTERM protein-sorting domain-containing protein n=1 Tax=Desulfonema limicola TaxID=45656 RepID=A0A975B957_9BACT|nr:choice-of-anchor L domain-containing protein [Desulfonema limicola]QTA81127.1 PEP-CTERM protein-sorting domain-containing protein [Desulfonema limicola]
MKKLTVFLTIALFVFSAPAFAMTITGMDTAENLAQEILGSGVTIFNVSYTGATAASGYFSGGIDAGIGIESGIVLTSGYASNLNGNSNTSDSITGNNGLSGLSELNTLIPGYSTYDATVLEFDFQSDADSAYFNYVFGSEEYNEYVGSAFNDVFGFFIDGVNYALIPGTTTPVSINNVNNWSNSAYYNDNDPGPYAFEYDGFTNKLTTEILGLNAGQTYHIKLAIADAGDYILDSGVFIQGGTFSDQPVPEPATILLLGFGLLGLGIRGRKRFKK